MRIGCPRERKLDEYRVALTPHGVESLVADGHTVLIETGAGVGSGFADTDYVTAGGRVSADPGEVYAADLLIKVKEPIAEEYDLIRENTLLFCYLHLAAVPELAKALMRNRVTAVAFETIRGRDGSRPLLTPMSLVAGRLSIQVGATALQKNHGGRGVLLAGLPGVPPGHVVVIGGGVVGRAAIEMAVGMGARVTVVDIKPATLGRINEQYRGRVETAYSSPQIIARLVAQADLLIGAVLIPGARAPHLVSKEMIASMPNGAVAVDVAVDQGGCFETTRPTTHRDPIYVVEGVLHYAVANMPSLTARTSTLGLANATLPVLRRLAGDPSVLYSDEGLREGLTTDGGKVVHPKVAEALGL